VVLNFQEEALPTEQVQVPAQRAFRLFGVALQKGARELAGEAGGAGNQAVGVRGEVFFIDAGVVVKAFQLAGGGDLEQVLVALHVFGQQHQVKGFFIFADVLIEAGARGKVGFQADNRLDAGRVGFLEEIQRAEHRAVVGQRHGRHAQFPRPGNQVCWFTKAVQN